jgi:hypothetical protein
MALAGCSTPRTKIISDNTIEAKANALSRGYLARPHLNLGSSYRVECEVTAKYNETNSFSDAYGVALQAGPTTGRDLNHTSREIRFLPTSGLIRVDDIPRNDNLPGRSQNIAVKDTKAKQHLRIDYSPRSIKTYLNNEIIQADVGYFDGGGIFQIGRDQSTYFVGPRMNNEEVYEISNVKVKLLEPNDQTQSEGYN